MDYYKWGCQYLLEAEKIKDKIQDIRANCKDDLQSQTFARTSLLYEMYLDCKNTGIFLQERGRQDAAPSFELRPDDRIHNC